MSDTPRCDAILYGARMVPVGAESMVEGYFARKLERELAAATERIAALERERDNLLASYYRLLRLVGWNGEDDISEGEIENNLHESATKVDSLERERDALENGLVRATADASSLRTEVERLTRQRDALILGLESGRASWKEENDALRALLRDIEIEDTMTNIGLGGVSLALRKRIRAALGEE